MIKLFNKKPNDKYKKATAFSLKGLGKQINILESKGLQLSKLSDIQNEIVFDFISLIEDSEE